MTFKLKTLYLKKNEAQVDLASLRIAARVQCYDRTMNTLYT